MSDGDAVTIPHQALEAMVQHARFAAPQEACGLFAIAAGTVTMVYCLTNTDRAANAYTIDPAEQFGAWSHARRNGWDIGGVFHSHPSSPPFPSPADLVGLDPDWVSIIVGPAETKAFRVREGAPTEVTIERG